MCKRYLLKILIGKCFHYLRPTNKVTETEGVKNWWKSHKHGVTELVSKPGSNCWGRICCLRYTSTLRYLWKKKENIAHVSPLPQPLLVPGMCTFILPSLWLKCVIQFYRLIFFLTLCFSILLHGFYSHHFNDLPHIPSLDRC